MTWIHMAYIYGPTSGYNARKVISEVYASFVLQWTISLGSNVNTRRMSNPDMESIFHTKKNNKICWS